MCLDTVRWQNVKTSKDHVVYGVMEKVGGEWVTPLTGVRLSKGLNECQDRFPICSSIPFSEVEFHRLVNKQDATNLANKWAWAGIHKAFQFTIPKDTIVKIGYWGDNKKPCIVSPVIIWDGGS